MRYQSTKNTELYFSDLDAVLHNYTEDGGLFVPEEIVRFTSAEWEYLSTLSTDKQMSFVLQKYLTSIPAAELDKSCAKAWAKISAGQSNNIAANYPGPLQLRALNAYTNEPLAYELWHGQGGSYYDILAALLPEIYFLAQQRSADYLDKKLLLVVASSAEMSYSWVQGFKDSPVDYLILSSSAALLNSNKQSSEKSKKNKRRGKGRKKQLNKDNKLLLPANYGPRDLRGTYQIKASKTKIDQTVEEFCLDADALAKVEAAGYSVQLIRSFSWPVILIELAYFCVLNLELIKQQKNAGWSDSSTQKLTALPGTTKYKSATSKENSKNNLTGKTKANSANKESLPATNTAEAKAAGTLPASDLRNLQLNQSAGLAQAVDLVLADNNLSNTLAALYAKASGAQFNSIVLTNNKNHLLADFIKSGNYNVRRKFYTTNSPELDVNSHENLQRLLFEFAERDSSKIVKWGDALAREGKFSLDEQTLANMQTLLQTGFADDFATRDAIIEIYANFDCMADTHLAVAYAAYKKMLKNKKSPDDKHSNTVVYIDFFSPYVYASAVADALLPDLTKYENIDEIRAQLFMESQLEIPARYELARAYKECLEAKQTIYSLENKFYGEREFLEGDKENREIFIAQLQEEADKSLELAQAKLNYLEENLHSLKVEQAELEKKLLAETKTCTCEQIADLIWLKAAGESTESTAREEN